MYQDLFSGAFHPFINETTASLMDGRLVQVVSDSQYKEYKQKQALEQVTILENRLNRLNTATQEIEAAIIEVKMVAGLLPESSETE